MQHDLQLRAAARAHFQYAHPFGPMRFEDAERLCTPAYRRAVEAAREEGLAIADMLAGQNQLELL